MNVSGNVTILTGGNWTLYNVTINFSMTKDGGSMLNKTKDGGLFIYDNDNNASTTTDASIITSNNSAFEYNFWVYGNAGNDNFTIRNSRITDAGTEHPKLIFAKAGISIRVKRNAKSS